MWVLVSVTGNKYVSSDKDSLEPIGSWTAFMKSVSRVKIRKAILEYLELVPLPPRDNVWKWYMDNLTKEAGLLNLECLFLYADEAVYSKLMMIKWLNEGLYEKIFPLLGGFHTLLRKLRILQKKYGLLGMRGWWVDSQIVAVDSCR